MRDLIKKIRLELQLSQEQFAAKMGVSPITVSRWENGKSAPNFIAQKQLYNICKDNHLELAGYIVGRANEIAEKENTEVEWAGNVNAEKGSTENIYRDGKSSKLRLYHASRFGITGKIEPKSRSKCDFGRGFYMGTNPLQPLTLVCNERKPVFYTVEMNLTDLKVLDIEVGLDWAMLIAYYRGYMDGAEGTEIYEKYAHMTDGCHVISGYIANDRMYQALTDFFEQRITDAALIASISALDLGKQYVAVTQKACDRIKITGERTFSRLELMMLTDKSEIRRREGQALVNQMITLHRRDGRYFDEILKGVVL